MKKTPAGGSTVIYCHRGRAPCGVLDHAAVTAALIGRSDPTVSFRSNAPWAISRDPFVRTVHVHYPSVGFGRRVWPLAWLLALRAAGKRVILTVHEYEQAHFLRKIMILLLAGASHVVFTPSPSLRARLGPRALPIVSGSNIDVVPLAEDERMRLRGRYGIDEERVVAFFGFSKTKGYDRFLALARILPAGWRAFVIGGLGHPPGTSGRIVYTGYLPSAEETSRCLQLADVFYLPYPDGLSERRGTFWAALAHGVPVITIEGPQTTDLCRGPGIVLLDPRDPVERVARLLEETASSARPQLPAAVSREAICAAYQIEYGRA